MRPVTAYATPDRKAPFKKTTIQRRDLLPGDVLIKIAYAGSATPTSTPHAGSGATSSSRSCRATRSPALSRR